MPQFGSWPGYNSVFIQVSSPVQVSRSPEAVTELAFSRYFKSQVLEFSSFKSLGSQDSRFKLILSSLLFQDLFQQLINPYFLIWTPIKPYETNFLPQSKLSRMRSNPLKINLNHPINQSHAFLIPRNSMVNLWSLIPGLQQWRLSLGLMLQL